MEPDRTFVTEEGTRAICLPKCSGKACAWPALIQGLCRRCWALKYGSRAMLAAPPREWIDRDMPKGVRGFTAGVMATHRERYGNPFDRTAAAAGLRAARSRWSSTGSM